MRAVFAVCVWSVGVGCLLSCIVVPSLTHHTGYDSPRERLHLANIHRANTRLVTEKQWKLIHAIWPLCSGCTGVNRSQSFFPGTRPIGNWYDTVSLCGQCLLMPAPYTSWTDHTNSRRRCFFLGMSTTFMPRSFKSTYLCSNSEWGIKLLF